MKNYIDLEQSKKLAEILPLESADLKWFFWEEESNASKTPSFGYRKSVSESYKDTGAIYLPCWSLTALLEYLKNINSTVYIPMLYVHDNKWMLQFVERGHGNVAEVECDDPVDACYEMIIKLHEQKLL